MRSILFQFTEPSSMRLLPPWAPACFEVFAVGNMRNGVPFCRTAPPRPWGAMVHLSPVAHAFKSHAKVSSGESVNFWGEIHCGVGSPGQPFAGFLWPPL